MKIFSGLGKIFYRLALLVVGVIISFSNINALLAADADKFTRLQSAYIYKIANYVEWPEASEIDPFNICVFEDENSLSDEIQRAAEKLKVRGKKVIVTSYTIGVQTSIHPCHLVYINQMIDNEVIDQWQAEEVLATKILWIASPKLSSNKVMFDLAKEKGKISIYVNKSKLSGSQLSVSAPLLSVSKPR